MKCSLSPARPPVLPAALNDLPRPEHVQVTGRLCRPVKVHSTAFSPAFTLVELLVVIAIIGILAAITIPTVARVRGSAQAAVCSSNLRQVYTALQIYLVDNKDRAPKAFDSSNNFYWHNYLVGDPARGYSRYLEDKRVLLCPSDKNDANISGSYAYGVFTIWYPSSHKLDADPLFFRKLVRPANWPVFMDADKPAVYALDDPNADADPYYRFAARHSGKANIVMADGHIERAAYGDLRWHQGVLNDGSFYNP
ncbi:MAG: prepilin-type N-terminal cleavage/methylation domain-containing protein [Opitutaceae bacterium]|jgi:prepilin-type N-terminal cleavage/methylation domain-containing protein/prepilin-type processing-associated H-X9-DG protein|nr:prepilin-type N-terminal cleavage/methylation domain-containing protein [Opitutaceae bacterium]